MTHNFLSAPHNLFARYRDPVVVKHASNPTHPTLMFVVDCSTQIDCGFLLDIAKVHGRIFLQSNRPRSLQHRKLCVKYWF